MMLRREWRAWPAAIVAVGLLAGVAVFCPTRFLRADDELTDPLIGNAPAIEEGRMLYRRHCFVCHLHAGGRGPNLFASRLNDQQFAQTVLNGQGMMPAWNPKLSMDDVWKLRAYVKSTGHYGD